jgi:hypothetical protein
MILVRLAVGVGREQHRHQGVGEGAPAHQGVDCVGEPEGRVVGPRRLAQAELRVEEDLAGDAEHRRAQEGQHVEDRALGHTERDQRPVAQGRAPQTRKQRPQRMEALPREQDRADDAEVQWPHLAKER